MAKKKKGGKVEKKGKGGKKGKKEKPKPSEKLNKAASAIAQAQQSGEIWEMRVKQAEKSKDQYQKIAEQWLRKNELLQSQIYQVEKDTIDVVTFLKRKDIEKDRKMESLVAELNNIQAKNKAETESLIATYQQRIQESADTLHAKNLELEWIHSEMKAVKEFRREKARMQKDLEEIKEALSMADVEYKRSMARMEQKFVEEKVRLQTEANAKVAELAERAHEEAVASLSDAAKSVFRENVRLNAALTIHRTKEQKLEVEVQQLQEENLRLSSELETTTQLLEQHEITDQRQKKKIGEFEDKVKVLEAGLMQMSKEFERERRELTEQSHLITESLQDELSKSQQLLDIKSRESARIKQLARTIVEQRTDVERFFLDSLSFVRAEIVAQRRQYKHDAQSAYEQRMSMALSGKASYPAIRTFQPSKTSTNNVFSDFAAAEMLFETGKPIDISELSWEQREKVLRYLFGRMNRQVGGSSKRIQSGTDADLELQIEEDSAQGSSASSTERNDLSETAVVPMGPSAEQSIKSDVSRRRRTKEKQSGARQAKPLLPALMITNQSSTASRETSSRAVSEQQDVSAPTVFITQQPPSDQQQRQSTQQLPPIGSTSH